MPKTVDVRDPWVTLEECFASATECPTLLWGDGIEYLAKDLRNLPWLSFFTHDAYTSSQLEMPQETRIYPDGEPFERVIIRLPASKEQFRAMLAWAQHKLVGARECWVFGHKNEGIRSAEKLLSDIGTEAECLRLKRRTRVLRTTLSPQDNSHEPVTNRQLITVGSSPIQCVSYPGVFSHGRLDPGTAALISFLSRHKPTSKIVDLGCGAGPIGLFLAHRWPESKIKLYDRSALAVIAARESMKLNNLENVTIAAIPVDAIPREPWHGLVVSNPPFHQGKETRTDLIGEFAQAARHQMRPGASFLAVANRHLPYRKPLNEVFHSVEIAWEDNSYCIWRSKGPRKTR